jgi:hypothetical protein
MIELSPEQRQAVAKGEPVPIVDPLTQDTYVLVRAEEYARLASVRQPPSEQPNPEITPLILRSQKAFWQDLTELLRDQRNHGKWVAYHGDERVALGRTDVDVYQDCFRHGLRRGEFYVGKIESDPDGVPPWGTLRGDWSLYEVTEGTPPDSA